MGFAVMRVPFSFIILAYDQSESTILSMQSMPLRRYAVTFAFLKTAMVSVYYILYYIYIIIYI